MFARLDCRQMWDANTREAVPAKALENPTHPDNYPKVNARDLSDMRSDIKQPSPRLCPTKKDRKRHTAS